VLAQAADPAPAAPAPEAAAPAHEAKAAEGALEAPVVREVKHVKGDAFAVLGDPADPKNPVSYEALGEFSNGRLTVTLAGQTKAKPAKASKMTVLAGLNVPAFKGHKGGFTYEVKDQSGNVLFNSCVRAKGFTCKRLEDQLGGMNKLTIEREQLNPSQPPKVAKSLFGMYFKDIAATWNVGQALGEHAPRCQIQYLMSLQVDDRSLGSIGLCDGEQGRNHPAVYIEAAKEGQEPARRSMYITDSKKLIELLEAKLPKP
jgi:hypothetical protein